MASCPLPAMTERKATLRGTHKEYACRLIFRAPGEAVLLFVSEAAVRVHALDLPAGTVTFGYFWVDRAYNVYHWMTPAGATIAHYFNLADRTSIAEQDLSWLDLSVDLLIRPGSEPTVLDEAEVPAVLDAATVERIESGKRALLARAGAVAREIERRSRELWVTAFGERRA